MILIAAVAAAVTIGWGVVKIASDEIIPELTSIGEIAPGINLSVYTILVLQPVSIIIDNIDLIIGLLYIVGIIGLLGLAYISRTNRNGWMIALFVVAVLIVIISSILISQHYEEFYLGQDELGAKLREAALVSYLVIYSPTILTIVAFIAAIILFTGDEEAQFR